MSCNDCTSSCTKVTCIPSCVCSITLGTIADNDIAVYVYLKNKILDRVNRFDALSDENGLVTLNLCPSPYLLTKYLIENQVYELWITKPDSQTRETITINSEEIYCMTFEVEENLGINEWVVTL